MPPLRRLVSVAVIRFAVLLCPPGALVAQAIPDSAARPYLNPDLPVDVRVADLVGRMTLEEKAGQMGNAAPAIPRLGIPAYDWWNEALHGVARAGVATVFPQAIGLAATWDTALMYRVATAISIEARAKHHESARQGHRGIYQGLTFWSPNINIFRDPRWGRGMETYGEDPYLAGRLAVQFVRGMQGDDPRYLRTVATPKHFAVHSGPEPDRHSFDAIPSERDLRETYLPHFEAAIVEGGALSIMCAYNRVFGDPACASTRLLGEILRGEWGFQGYVVSDCWAITDVHQGHRVARDETHAAAMSLSAGTDLACGPEYKSLPAAVRQGLIPEAVVDSALIRLYRARFRLGLFDPPDRVPYAAIPPDSNDSEQHQALARETARKSLVLLKNDGGALPLASRVKTIAVIGPNADDVEVLLGNYNGTPRAPVTPLQGLRRAAAARGIEVRYARGADLAPNLPSPDSVPAARLLNDALAAARGADAAVLFLGLSPRLEGEEMRVEVPGFAGGDRIAIGLPDPQEQLLQAIVAGGTPVVLVLLSGSALAIPWAAEHVPAMVQAWYPGQAAGDAIADVLFGSISPGGRLPITVYRTVDDLPPFSSYAMEGRTYRYFRGQPLFPFGHGLSYSRFRYRDVRVPARVRAGDEVEVSVEVENAGAMSAEEVVQLYVTDLEASVPVPLRSLAGFRRVALAPGARIRVALVVRARAFSLIDAAGRRVIEPGRFEIAVGGKQPGQRGVADAGTTEVLTASVEVVR